MDILNIEVWRNVVTTALSSLWEKIAGFAPNLVGAIIILILGYLVSKIAARACASLLSRIGFDKACDRIGIHQALGSTGIETKGSALMALVIFWLIMLMFLISVSETLGLDRVASTVEAFVLYLPNVIAAAVIFVIGSVIAGFVRGLVSSGANRLGMEYEKPLANFVYGVLIVVIAMLAIEQLQFDTRILANLIQILIIAAGTALAITMGLGTRQISHELVSGIYARDVFANGDRIRIDDTEGVMEEIGAVSSCIALADGQKVQIPNHKLISSTVTRLS